MWAYSLLMSLALLHLSLAEQRATNNNSFIATKDWQEIPEGNSVPAGLHVRINLQTGKKEAKLIDETEESNNRSLIGTKTHFEDQAPSMPDGQHNVKQSNAKISKTLSDALKDLQKERAGLEYSPENLSKIKRSYKTYKELKESYEEIRNKFKTDGEIITDLLQEFNNATKAEHDQILKKSARVKIHSRVLESLNYLVHQIDNSLIFINQGGLNALLPIVVNETVVDLRIKAMRVLGALIQNNPQAQIKVFERNFGTYLSKVLISSMHTEELSSALYAFGSLIRKFPFAEQRILSTSGMQALITVLAKKCELKIKAKVVTLISDIIVEQKSVMSAPLTEQDHDATTQYAELKLTDWLTSNGYCETIETLFIQEEMQFLSQPDLLEYFVVNIGNTLNICHSQWAKNDKLHNVLLILKNQYTLSEEEYHREVGDEIAKVYTSLYVSESLQSDDKKHDEL